MNILIHQIKQMQGVIKGGLISEGILLSDPQKICQITKGQLISKCLLGVIVSTKKTNEISLRISALASKKRSNQKK